MESGGADLPTQAELFVHAGRISSTELTGVVRDGHSQRVPGVRVTPRRWRHVPGMSDYAVLVDKQAQGLAGPPLVKMATGEDADDESLGGADTPGSPDR